jgi:hypothetical protein
MATTPGGDAVDAQRYDAFVSYAHRDATWVQVLAANLHRAGLEVFLDRWEITTGDRLAEQLQRGLARSRAVVLVVSSASVTRPWWQEEFAAAVTAAVDGGQRLVPVLLDDVRLPPFVASRVRVDFRHTDSPDAYHAAFDDLLRAVRAQPQADRPERDGRVVVPPAVYRAEGPRSAGLRITADEVTFSTADREERQPTSTRNSATAPASRSLTVSSARCSRPPVDLGTESRTRSPRCRFTWNWAHPKSTSTCTGSPSSASTSAIPVFAASSPSISIPCLSRT